MSEQLLILRVACAAALAMTCVHPVGAQELTPFRASNLNPPSAIIGLPLWVEVPTETAFGSSIEIANHYRLKRRLDDQIVLDGETVRLRGYLEQPVGERWSIGVDVPYVYQSGGSLDDIIDAWHSAFRLPDGARNQRPEGVLEFNFTDAGGSFYELTDSGGGFGDVQLSFARRIGSARGWHLRATLKLPTGQESLLAGSGSTDFALSALRVVRGNFASRSASYYFGGALLDIEQPELVRFPTEDRAFAGIIGGALALGPRFGIKGQIDANSALYYSQLEELGQTAVQATLGGWLRFGERGIWEFAISEDVHVSTTPDVAIFFSLNWSLR